jgi:plastocyanin
MIFNKNRLNRMFLLLLMAAILFLQSSMANMEMGTGTPMISISSPKNGADISGDSVTVMVNVSDFNLVNKLGKPNVAGEGHIHYFMDALIPTAPGKPAITAPGTFVPTINTSFVWKNVTPRMHNFSVELVNNDHTPLTPPITDRVSVKVKGSDDTIVNIAAKNIAFNISTITVPSGANVTVNFDNQDAGIPHNVAFYTAPDANQPIYVGAIFQGPKIMVYKFKAPDTPGTYFFRCDVHPTNMKGDFIVT